MNTPTESPVPLLEIRDLTVSFPGNRQSPSKTALDSVSLSLHRNASLAVAGPSGCGKSTLIRTIAGLQTADCGTVLWNRQSISSLTVRERLDRGIRIQMIFQDPSGSLDPRRTIGQSIRDAVKTFTGCKGFLDTEIAENLDAVGIPPTWADRYPHELSGGQRQRACIARALACQPDLLLCDEPVSALDVTTQGQIIRLLRTLRDRYGFSILFVGHDLAVLQIVSEDLLFLENGRIAESGPTLEILKAPHSRIARALIAASR